MDVKAGMPPRHDELEHFLCDLPFPQKHPQDFVLKDLFQGPRVQWRRHLERSASIKSAIGAEDVAMGIEVQEIPEGLDSNDCPGSSLVFWNGAKEKHLQGIPRRAAQLGEEFSIIEEVAAEDLWYAEGEVPVGDGLEDLLTKPFPEFHYSLLVTGPPWRD